MDCIDSTIPLDANKVVPAVNYALSGLIGKGGLGDRGNVNEMIRIESRMPINQNNNVYMEKAWNNVRIMNNKSMNNNNNERIFENAFESRRHETIMRPQPSFNNNLMTNQHSFHATTLSMEQQAYFDRVYMNDSHIHPAAFPNYNGQVMSDNFSNRTISSSHSHAWAEEIRNKNNSWASEFENREVEGDHNEMKTDVKTSNDLKSTANDVINSLNIAAENDPRMKESELYQFMNAIRKGEIDINGDKIDEFSVGKEVNSESKVMEGAWGDLNVNENVTIASEDSHFESAWMEALNKVSDADYEGLHNDEIFENAWKDAIEEAKRNFEMNDDRSDFNSAWMDEEAVKPYSFDNNNPLLDHENSFEKGMYYFEQGSLSLAVLAFEAEVQRDANNSEAWRMLGLSHAENDEDKKAISCLQEAINVDPYNLDALLALGVSYVNEMDNERALFTLKTWVQHNPKFHGLEIETDAYSDGTLLDEVQQLMLKARAWESNDSDVLQVLGVLYNVSHDYTNAIEAFNQATILSPSSYSLWNKLGATLANGSQSHEALSAYEKSLSIKPKYARGWLNVGISHANLGNYAQAAAAYLQALALNNNATHIWPLLRISLTNMERYDLVKKSDFHDPSLFIGDFSFSL